MIIRKLRNKNKWSQEQLADLCGLNVRTIQRVESGNKASLETLKSLAAVFQVEISVLAEQVTVIDKKSELWRTQPGWFKLLFFGVPSRKVQIWLELSLVLFSLLALFLSENKLIAASLFVASYITSLSIRYGDSKDIW